MSRNFCGLGTGKGSAEQVSCGVSQVGAIRSQRGCPRSKTMQEAALSMGLMAGLMGPGYQGCVRCWPGALAPLYSGPAWQGPSSPRARQPGHRSRDQASDVTHHHVHQERPTLIQGGKRLFKSLKVRKQGGPLGVLTPGESKRLTVRHYEYGRYNWSLTHNPPQIPNGGKF